MTDIEHRGVWLSDAPLDCNEGAYGSTVLDLEIPSRIIDIFEWKEEGKTYREFLVPAAIVNQHGKPRVIEE